MSFSPSSRPESVTWRVDLCTAAVVGILAAAARIAVSAAVPESAPFSDMQEYWERALYIAEHGRLYENSWRMPGYPAALAFMFALDGAPSLGAARLLNVIAGTASTLLAYWLARRSAGPGISSIAALAVALYPSFLVYTTLVTTEMLVVIPLLAALIAASYGTPRASIAAGVFTGLTVLMRPAGVALLPAVLLALARRTDADGRAKWTLRNPAIAIVLFAVTMAPWWVHSVRLHARFVPLDTTGGLNLLIGNGPLATGQWDWSAVSRLQGEDLRGVDPTTPAGSDRASAIALAYVRAHPIDTIRLIPARMAALLALEGREHAYLYSLGYFGPRRSAVVWLWGIAILAAFPVLLSAAVVGCAIRAGIASGVLWPSLAFLGASLAMHAVSFGDPRFHLPMVPVLAVLTTGLTRWRSRIVVWRVVAAALMLLLLLVPWSTQLATYWDALTILAAPNGWSSQLSFDDLL